MVREHGSEGLRWQECEATVWYILAESGSKEIRLDPTLTPKGWTSGNHFLQLNCTSNSLYNFLK